MINFEWKNEIDKFIRSTFSGGNTRNFSEIWWQYQTCFWCQHHKHFWWWYHIALCLASNTHLSQSGWKLVTGELLVWAHTACSQSQLTAWAHRTYTLTSGVRVWAHNMSSHLRFVSWAQRLSWNLVVSWGGMGGSRAGTVSQWSSRRPGCVRRTSPANTQIQIQIQLENRQIIHLDVVIRHVQLLTHRRRHIVPE